MIEIGRSRFLWPLLMAWGALSACSSFSHIVRHSDPLTPDQHMQLGASYETQGLKEDARQQYEAALHLQRKYEPALIALGNLAFESGDWKGAEKRYRQVLRGDRDHAGANNNMAMVFLARGKDLDKAEQFAQTALKQGGALRPYVLETLASIYIRQSRTLEAQKCLDEADAAAGIENTALREQLAKTREALEARE